MRIIQVQTQAEAAGAQRISDMVGEGLRARGHDVRTVFMYRKTDAFDGDPHADFVLAEPPKELPGQVRAAIGLAAYLRAARPDAVISYQHYGNIFGTIGARLAGVRHIVANQSGAPQTKGVMGLLSRIDRLMGVLGLYQANVVNSAWTQAQFDRYPQAYRRRLRRIDHGVPAPADDFDKAAARAAFGLPRDAWLAVSSGRLTQMKNQIALVGALERLPDVHVALAGVGPERDALVDFAGSRGLADRLHLVGEVPTARIFEFLAAGDAYAFPSTTETFGLACVEAAISGLPVVSNDLEVMREVLTAEDGEAAAIFVKADADGMAGGLAEMLARPELMARLSAAGRRLRDKYSPARMCAGYEALLLP
ncbi:glycosyltransferase family 4 protein [Mesorhizobium sp.]|uniref:glycosyltransferase family 4 protein n=2 Tax=unclassified Mesorhizobium TaxID=325217 RepID=UPI000FD45E3C|nr:glycosyltransferase family 4 protein [Mesorhizobium sp.]RVC59971.1 glycosyltransferase family 1 protein [Mesorhizobium sp. M4B.F.Ca.ET.088.02.2.1]RWA62644.1 MAG: glycosyltransferase family 1 protein [Mesorhizobium sp.]RWF33691.1 MAG: glycosyltransferase family 1 protein [Mesorhizobium sp.]RWF43729.1 MAG: glycosyltransferase family 1 protein [Mesorhizobium sp.]TIX17817.1 MAG: glycosyltransferase family 4 protein [Mesorhizobium sp.]